MYALFTASLSDNGCDNKTIPLANVCLAVNVCCADKSNSPAPAGPVAPVSPFGP